MLLPAPIRTPRLLLSPLTAGETSAFHALITDAHVRQFIVDGEVMPLEWSAHQVERSLGLFERIGSGLWLARPPEGAGEPIGFCGFVDLPHSGLGPELIYALREAGTGKGLATEMARAMIEHARQEARLERIPASVDAVNDRSVRVLEKLGFQLIETRAGAFGDLLVFAMEEAKRAEPPLEVLRPASGAGSEMSWIQRFLLRLLPRRWAESMEAESRTWMVRCRCGFARSVWDLGGLRWKGRGKPRQWVRCPQCGERSWHEVVRERAG